MPFSRKEKKLSDKEVYRKISSWCAYQERCHQEVRSKLYEFGIKNDVIEEIIFQLISENFLNEERFAKAFAGGKFRIKRWGRVRIVMELKQRDISPNCIKLAMTEIEEEDYTRAMEELIVKKSSEFSDKEDIFQVKKKIADYLIRKGYEPELVWQKIKGHDY